jgi:hypothetical protein
VETPAQFSTKTRASLEPNSFNNFFEPLGIRFDLRLFWLYAFLRRRCLSWTAKCVLDPEIGPFRKALSSSSRMSG